ncbi:unnamed protein product [Calypogeia fissa]
MAYRHPSWRHPGMLRLALPRRYTKTEGSTNVGCSRGGSWGLDSVFTGSFAARHNVIGGTQEWTACCPDTDGTRAWSGASAVSSGSPCFGFETVKRKYGKLWQQQSYPDLFRAVICFSNVVHPQLSQPFSLISKLVHTSPVVSQAESFTGVDAAVPNGTQERMAEQPFVHQIVVKQINELLSQEGWESALDQLNLHLCPQVVSDVIRRQPNVSTALSFFQWTKRQQGFHHTGRTYKAILQKLMSHQDFMSRNLDTFHLIMDESLQNGWSPGVTIHTYLIDGYCKRGRVDEAFAHFDEMVSHGCAPNVVTYSSLIGGLLKVGRIQGALDLLDKMEENKCYPNVVTYSVIINGLIKHHQLEEAWKIFERMKKEGCTPNLITYSTLIDGVAKERKFEEVSKLLDQMRETRCTPSLFIYGTVINYFVKAGKLEQAWALFFEMKKNGLEPNLFVYTPLVTSLGKAGNWEQAQELLKEMKLRNCAPDVITYSALIAGLVQAGKWKEGVKVLDQMEANGCYPNEVTYTILIDGLVKARQADIAQALFKRMVANGCTVTVYTEDVLGKVLARIRPQ